MIGSKKILKEFNNSNSWPDSSGSEYSGDSLRGYFPGCSGLTRTNVFTGRWRCNDELPLPHNVNLSLCQRKKIATRGGIQRQLEAVMKSTLGNGETGTLRVEFLLKTDSGYPRDAEVTLFTLANPESSLRFNTHWSAPPVSALARSGGPRKITQLPVSRNSNIERRMYRPKSVVGVIRGVA